MSRQYVNSGLATKGVFGTGSVCRSFTGSVVSSTPDRLRFRTRPTINETV